LVPLAPGFLLFWNDLKLVGFNAVVQALEAREAEDLCRSEDLRMEAMRKENST
jgi:hypothetical protein